MFKVMATIWVNHRVISQYVKVELLCADVEASTQRQMCLFDLVHISTFISSYEGPLGASGPLRNAALHRPTETPPVRRRLLGRCVVRDPAALHETLHLLLVPPHVSAHPQTSTLDTFQCISSPLTVSSLFPVSEITCKSIRTSVTE